LKKGKIILIAFILLLILCAADYFSVTKYPDCSPLKFIEGLSMAGLFYLLTLFSKFNPFENSHKTGTETSSENPPSLKSDPKFSLALILFFALFSSYKFIYFYTSNITGIPFSFILGFVLVTVAAFLLIFAFFKAIFKDDIRPCLLAFILIIAFSVDIPYFKMWTAYSGAVLFLCILILSFLSPKNLISFLKPFGAALLVLCLLNGGYKILDAHFKNNDKAPFFEVTEKAIKAPNRDIYIILLDAYAGKRSLQSIGFDNSKFYEALRQRGFFVYENMESNYLITHLSLPSFLNASYLDDVPYKDCKKAIANAKMFKIAKKAGFKTVYLNSYPLDLEVKKSNYIDNLYSSRFSLVASIFDIFIGNTIFSPLVGLYDLKNDNDKFLSALETADKIIEGSAKDKENYFAFLHFLMPHAPYMYNEKGELYEGFDRWDITTGDYYVLNKEAYTGFLQYANKKTLAMVDKMFELSEKNSSNKPIIIILGDHGMRPVGVFQNTHKYEDLINKNLKYYYNTSVAYYNPDLDPESHKDVKSHVNFAINFLNDNFGTSIKNLEDKQFNGLDGEIEVHYSF